MGILLLSVFSLQAQTLVHYWNFNNNASVEAITTPNVALVAGSSIIAENTGTSVIAYDAGTGQNFNVENLNARNGDPSGTHLRYNFPIGGKLIYSLPTTGYENIIVKFTTRRSGSGAGTQKWYYSTDGTTYNFLQNVIPQDANPQLITFDLSTISGIADNANFKLKVEFEAGNGGTVGNNRFDNFTLDANSKGGTDTNAPVVTYFPANGTSNVATSVQPTISFSEEVRNIDDSPITNENAANLVVLKLNNENGTDLPFSTTFENNKITIVPTSIFPTNATVYVALKANLVEDLSHNAVTNPAAATFNTANTKVSFQNTFAKVNEEAGNLTVKINVENPSDATVKLVVKGAPFSTANNQDFTLASQTLTITPETSVFNINIPIIDDSAEEQQAEYFVLALEEPNGVQIGTNALTTVYIIDNDKQAPVPAKNLSLHYIGSFDPSNINNSTTEIVVHDPATQRLFTISSITDVYDIIDFSDPTAPSTIKSVDMLPYGGITSIAVKNGIVAVASPNTNVQGNGSVVFFDTDGNFLKQVSVGALPDMVTFTPDGTKVLTANEGEPNDSYTADPEGSISIIDISGGIGSLSQSNVTTLDFTQFNGQEAALLATGIRTIYKANTLSQNFEPEYISVTADSQKAYVVLQENNAIAEVNLATNSISDLWALGTKDMSIPGNGFDASDNNGEILIANWPVKAYYIPDGIATFNIGGTNYIATANEGDEKDISGFSERTTVGANGYQLDPSVFPQAEVLKASYNLGRFRVTSVNGDENNDGKYETIHALGSRSFSIFNADTKQLVYDSGDDFERFTAKNYTSIFNADNESNAAKNRSRAKGPEPEGVTVADINGKKYAFITLERVGGIMAYDISNPAAPVFEDYKNPRSTSAYSGDHGPEGVTYISPEHSANGKAYVIVANEISGTLGIYEIETDNETLGTGNTNNTKTFNIFPNPVNKNSVLYFNRNADYELYDMSGKLLKKSANAQTVDTSNLQTGVYLIKTGEGVSKRIIVK